MTEIAYRIQGAGEPLLLVAGTAFAGATWPPGMIELLAARYTVITFDHRGTGATPPSSEPYSTRLFAADAVQLLEHLSASPAHVIGHSMGGRVAQWIALDSPRSVRSLVLAASGSGGRGAVTGVPLRQALGLAEKGYRRYMDEQLRATFFTPEAARSAEADWLVETFWRTRPSLEDYLKHVVARQQHDTADVLDRVRHPSLVVVGDRDTHVGGTGSHLEQSRYLAANLPAADYMELPGVAHGYFWQATDESTRAVMDWLAALPPPHSGSSDPGRAGADTQAPPAREAPPRRRPAGSP
jgi:pimeloyl-ACP methyl ester carboxylesterase